MQEDDEYISKSQRKRECDALQDLGIELTELSEQQLKEIPLPDVLYKAIIEAKKIHKYGALKRHRQYIGKLMRKADAETIEQHVQRFKLPQQQQNLQFKQLEQWRDRMLAEGDVAVNAFIADYFSADRQKLRQLVKNAQKEKQQNRAPTASRQLFKYLRNIVEDTE